jgi:hypothetical protein
MFHQRDLPAQRVKWDPLFLAAMGSPDPYGRQLNGMGGGISSLSKVCVIAPSTRKDADLDYTFAQVQIREPRVDYRGNCGNMSSAVGPFAMDEGLVRAEGDMATVRIYNTNTKKLIHATFPLHDNLPRYDGDLVIPGVAGSGAPVRLDFIAPGGATTGKLLPTGHPVDTVDVPGVGRIAVSMVDAGNAAVFLRAADLGLNGTELPEQLETDTALLARLQAIRQCAAGRHGYRARQDRGRHHRGRANDWLCRSSGGCAHLDRRDDRQERGRSYRTLPVERAAASSAAVDGLALHWRRRMHRRYIGGRSAGAGREDPRGHPHRHAIRHPGGRCGGGTDRPQRVDRAARLVLPHHAPAVCWTALSSTVMKRS